MGHGGRARAELRVATGARLFRIVFKGLKIITERRIRNPMEASIKIFNIEGLSFVLWYIARPCKIPGA